MANTSAANKTREVGEMAKDSASRVAKSALEGSQACAEHYLAEPAKDLLTLMKDYAREHPDVASLWCFVAGVVVGWKLRG